MGRDPRAPVRLILTRVCFWRFFSSGGRGVFWLALCFCLQDNIYCEEDFLIPLEATVLAMQRSNDSAAAIVESIEANDGPSVLAMLLGA